MSYSPSQYTGSGIAGPYTVGFPYLSQSHVEVRVAGVLKTVLTHYTWATSSTIQFTAGNFPANPDVIDIRRRSSPDARLVDFQDAAGLTEASLDLADNQLFYLTQEAEYDATSKMGQGADLQWDAQTRKIENVTNGSAASDAVTMAQLAQVGLSPIGTVAIANGGTGQVTAGAARVALSVPVLPPQGRLTLTSGTPVLKVNTVSQNTIYYTPYVGAHIPLYDGTYMVPTPFSEMSQLSTDTTKSPAAVAADKMYDLFVWNDAGTLRCTRGPAWTNDTTRGYTLTRTNGIWLNTSAITNGPAALRGTYVGTAGSNGSSLFSWQYGSAAAGGVGGVFGLWNAYNRVDVKSFTSDTTASWTYNVAAWKEVNSSTANRCTFVDGLSDDMVFASYDCYAWSTSGDYAVGIGLDSTSALAADAGEGYGSSGTFSARALAMYAGYPGVGRHFIQAIERQYATTSTATFVGAGSRDMKLITHLKM